MEHIIGRYFIRLFQTLNHFSSPKEFQEEEGFRFYAVQHLAFFNEIELSDLEDHSLGFKLKVVKQTKIDEILEDLEGFTERIKTFTKNEIRTELLDKGYQTFHEGRALYYFLDIRCWVKINYEYDIAQDILKIMDIRTGDLNTEEEYYKQLYKEFIGLTF